MTKYKYLLWCDDCIDEDYQGCFGGGTEESEESFETCEEAEEAAEKATDDCSLWTYKIYEDDK